MGTTKETFKHAAIYSLAAILGKMVSFFMLPFYAHILRDIGYGIIGMVDISLSFLMSLLAYGIQGGIIRFYHDEPEPNKPRVVSTGMLLAGGATLVLIGVFMLLSRPLSHLLLGDSSHAGLLCLALGAFFFDLTGQAAAAILIIRQRSVHFSVLGLVRLFVGLSLNIYLIIILKLGLLGYFLSALITAALSGSAFVIITIRSCGLTFDRRIARQLVAFQLPLVPGTLISFVSRQVERILVRFQIGLETVGIMEMGYKFPLLLSMLISGPFMRSWNTKRTEIAEQPEAPERIGRMFTYFLFLVTTAGLVLAVNIRGILQILTPPEFWPAYRIALIEIITMIMEGSYFHLNFGLYYAKATKTMAVIRGTTSIVKVGLAFIFIALWGFYGAAFSACITTAIMLVWGASKAQARYRLMLEYRKIACMIVSAVAIFLILDRSDLSRLALVQLLQQDIFPGFIELLRATPVGEWKAGAVIRILAERSDLLAVLFVKTLGCLVFAVYFPVVHDQTRRRLLARVQRLLGRAVSRTPAGSVSRKGGDCG